MVRRVEQHHELVYLKERASGLGDLDLQLRVMLGSEISLGHTRVDVADYKLVSATPASEAGKVAIRIEPQDAGGGEVFEYLTKDPTPVRRPPPPPRRKRSKHKSKHGKRRKR